MAEETTLNRAAESEHEAVMRLLSEKRISTRRVLLDGRRSTGLLGTDTRRWTVLGKGADVNAKTADGKAVLYRAVKNMHGSGEAAGRGGRRR